jgi:hypothetical protein
MFFHWIAARVASIHCPSCSCIECRLQTDCSCDQCHLLTEEQNVQHAKPRERRPSRSSFVKVWHGKDDSSLSFDHKLNRAVALLIA